MRYIKIILFCLISINVFASNIKTTLEKNLIQNFEKRGIKDLNIEVNIIKEVEDLKGYYLVKAVITDKRNNKKIDQFLLTNGNVLIPDLIDLSKGYSILKDMIFSYDITNIDTSKLTLFYGNKNAKNVIVKVSDFECPFCRKDNEYLESKLNSVNKKDIAIYMLNYPLSIHKKAMLYAKIFEAGMALGKNFMDQLYSGKYDNMDDNRIIETFANLSGKKMEFEKLVNSKEISDRINDQMKYAEQLGVNSTPIIFINGRKVEGYNTQLIDKGFTLLK
ncbi:DsbA family protein [Calditerrivibrio sp.]|uniref:DsbA family protein n=1 Tax=Calditerrivibrio sp. TaxID=2792612 RepID=UPI003D128071